MSDTTQIFQKKLGLHGRRTLVLGESFAPVAAALDALLIICLSIAAGILYHLIIYDDPGLVLNYLRAGLLVAIFYVTPRSFKKQYDLAEIFADPHAPRHIFYVWNFAIFCVLVIGFVAKLSDDYSRGALILFYFSGLLGLLLLRAITMAFIRRGFHSGWLASKSLLLLGTEKLIHSFRKKMSPIDYGLQIVGIKLLPEIEKGESKSHFAARFSDMLEHTVEQARKLRIDHIVLLLPWSETGAIKACREAFLKVPAATILGAEQILGRALEAGICRIGPSSGLNLVRAPLNIAETFTKRCMDLFLATIALIILAPLLLVIAVLVKLDGRGSVFFLQHRHGFNQEPFRIYKFRTMTVTENGENFNQVTENDPRVTPLGRFIRRWNIDELPQIINVLKGEMSLVGPRPHALVHNHEYQDRIALYARRHNVKPGITGWAQVNGYRGRTDTEDKMLGRVEHDLYYIDNWSIWFDVQIILMTMFSRSAFENAC